MISKRQFEQLLKTHAKSVARILGYYTSDKAQIKDWMQDVFLKVWENRTKIDPTHPRVKGYILRIARNHAIYELDRKKSVSLVLEDPPEKIAVNGNNIHESIAKKELTKAYRHALQKVPARAREAFILSRDQHLTYNEIAHAMDISPNTVENQIRKTLRILRTELKDYRA